MCQFFNTTSFVVLWYYWNKKYNSDEMWEWVAGLFDTKQITILDVIN